MDQFTRMIANRERALDDIARINVDIIARGDVALACRNGCEALEQRFGMALLRWRSGLSPVADMTAVLQSAADLTTSIVEWDIGDDILHEYGHVWNLVRYTSRLLHRRPPVPAERLSDLRARPSAHSDVALDGHVLDALDGIARRGDTAELLARIAAQPRRMLAAATYRTYLDLIDARDAARIDALVREAENHYRARARDAFYDGGPAYMGGGPNNPYMVDFALAAVLKSIGWTGRSVHRWIW